MFTFISCEKLIACMFAYVWANTKPNFKPYLPFFPPSWDNFLLAVVENLSLPNNSLSLQQLSLSTASPSLPLSSPFPPPTASGLFSLEHLVTICWRKCFFLVRLNRFASCVTLVVTSQEFCGLDCQVDGLDNPHWLRLVGTWRPYYALGESRLICGPVHHRLRVFIC